MKNLILLILLLVIAFVNSKGVINHTGTKHAQKQFIATKIDFKTTVPEKITISDELDATSVECESVERIQIHINRNDKLLECFTFKKIVISALHPMHYDLPPPELIFPG